jgi:hypothetical protein
MTAIKRGRNDGETIGEYTHRKLIDYLDPLHRLVESVGGTVQDTDGDRHRRAICAGAQSSRPRRSGRRRLSGR